VFDVQYYFGQLQSSGLSSSPEMMSMSSLRMPNAGLEQLLKFYMLCSAKQSTALGQPKVGLIT
jgi:hypothetical protein